MSATQQAAEIVVGDEAYETLFRGAPAPEASRFCDLPIDRLRPFFTADIGFHPYSPEKLRAFSQQLAEQGIYERVIVRPIPDSNDYEILAGHNRTRAWQMTGHDMIPAEVVSATTRELSLLLLPPTSCGVRTLPSLSAARHTKPCLMRKSGKGQEQTSELLARIARSSSPVK